MTLDERKSRGLMKFIKSVSPEDPVIKPIMDEFGFDGYGRFVAVLQFCRNYEIETLDLETIVKQAKTNKRGAQKLLPKFQECLTKVLQKFGESFTKVSPKFDQSLPKLEGQNPHGSTRDLEEKRIDKNRTTTPLPPNAENLGSGSGVFFEIENKGQRLTEDEWIFRNLMEHRRNKGWKSEGAVDLQSLISLYPNHLEQFKSWATLPMARRIAAFAFAAIKVTPDNHFKYALKMARDGTGEEFEKFLYQAQKQVTAKDYLVRIN